MGEISLHKYDNLKLVTLIRQFFIFMSMHIYVKTICNLSKALINMILALIFSLFMLHENTTEN